MKGWLFNLMAESTGLGKNYLMIELSQQLTGQGIDFSPILLLWSHK